LKPKAPIRRRWTSNDDRVPMSDNTLNKALRIMGCDTGTGGGRCAHGFCLTASTLLNEEGAFDGDVVEAQLAPNTEAKAPAARRGGAAPAWKDGKNKSAGLQPCGLLGNAYIQRSIWSDRPDSLRDGASAVLLRRSAV
jgi:hypothetical protein